MRPAPRSGLCGGAAGSRPARDPRACFLPVEQRPGPEAPEDLLTPSTVRQAQRTTAVGHQLPPAFAALVNGEFSLYSEVVGTGQEETGV